MIDAQPCGGLHEVRSEQLLKPIAVAVFKESLQRLLHNVFGEMPITEEGCGKPQHTLTVGCCRPDGSRRAAAGAVS